ncbi:hypothetical protein WJX82_005884 [Trebouxia sp. C0006]
MSERTRLAGRQRVDWSQGAHGHPAGPHLPVLEHSSAGRLSLFLSRQESLAAPATKQVQGTPFVWRHWTNSRPANKFRIYSYVQLLDDFNSSGGLGVPDGCFVSSNCCVLRRPSSPTVVETTCDVGDASSQAEDAWQTSDVEANCSAASQGVHPSAAAPAPASPVPLQEPAVAPGAQPAALLLVDVLTATNVAAINAPKDQQSEEGASDVQQMQQIVCGLTFEDTLNNAHTGTWGVRTRAITANSGGKVERLILELKDPIRVCGGFGRE